MGWIQKSGENFANCFQKFRWIELKSYQKMLLSYKYTQKQYVKVDPFKTSVTHEKHRDTVLNWVVLSNLNTQHPNWCLTLAEIWKYQNKNS